ncbi:MAG: endonuclease/exonuclease/phosphatase family protein [Pseudomonadota bacterium]|nr:endonuclease/exonuclease/phosphatase family protein [Pseudomonadota bacterium]
MKAAVAPAPPATWPARLRYGLMRRQPVLLSLAMLGLSLPLWQARVRPPLAAWLMDLAVHWQWPYLMLGTLAVSLWLALAPHDERRHMWPLPLLFAALAALTMGVAVLPRLPAMPADGGPAAEAASIKVVSFNVQIDNASHAAILDWVDAARPDVLALLEVTPAMAPLVDALATRFPQALSRPRDDPFGLAVFSRHPWQDARVETPEGGTPAFWARLQAPGGDIGLHVIHPMPPVSAADRATRDALFARLAAVPQDGLPRVLMGDFNATPWSAGLRRLGEGGWARANGLRPTFALGRSLPIDHILATPAHWRRGDTGLGPWLGSDHRPVWARLHRVSTPPANPQ